MAWVEEGGAGLQGCDSGEVEDVCHWLLQCSAWNSLQTTFSESHERCRERLLNIRQWRQNSPYIITCMFRNYQTLSIINSMCSARLTLSICIIHTLSLLTLVPLRMIQFYPFLCYIGPCGILVYTYMGTVHSNKEFGFQVIYI